MKYSLIAILLFSFTALQAQVKGTVKDNLGDPIAGANLFWQGTTQGTTTSATATFSRQASKCLRKTATAGKSVMAKCL